MKSLNTYIIERQEEYYINEGLFRKLFKKLKNKKAHKSKQDLDDLDDQISKTSFKWSSCTKARDSFIKMEPIIKKLQKHFPATYDYFFNSDIWNKGGRDKSKYICVFYFLESYPIGCLIYTKTKKLTTDDKYYFFVECAEINTVFSKDPEAMQYLMTTDYCRKNLSNQWCIVNYKTSDKNKTYDSLLKNNNNHGHPPKIFNVEEIKKWGLDPNYIIHTHFSE